MTIDAILDRILIPRCNGSSGLERTAEFIAEVLRRNGAAVTSHEFEATPHGFQLVWTAPLLLMCGYVAAIGSHHYRTALLLAAVPPVILLLEFELLRSPVSGLLARTERNVIGTFPGRADGPLLIFGAHYDTTTHFGDHLQWGVWGRRLGPAVALAFAVGVLGLWRARGGNALPTALAMPAAVLSVVPFAVMAWFQAVGPLVRAASPGAIDNGGSVAALLRLAATLHSRPADSPTTVKLVFFAAEEERTLGSWAYARSLDAGARIAVVNLESVGAGDDLAYVSEDGFATRRYYSPAPLVALVAETARELWGAPLPLQPLPFGSLTDGRSFLAHGIPAVTIRPRTHDAFPRRLHSVHDSRDRLSVTAIERSVALLEALVERVDRDPRQVMGYR